MSYCYVALQEPTKSYTCVIKDALDEKKMIARSERNMVTYTDAWFV